jgi:hypothetical protein
MVAMRNESAHHIRGDMSTQLHRESAAAARIGIAVLLLATALPAHAREGAYDWRLARELYPGIAFAREERVMENAKGLECPHYRGFSPEKPRRLRLCVLRVDLGMTNLQLIATGRAAGWGDPMPDVTGGESSEYVIRTRRETTADFIRGARHASREMLVAVNAQPWSPFDSGVDHPYADRLGLTVSGGRLVSPANGNPSFIRYHDGRPAMAATGEATDLAGIDLALTGFGFCLVDGEPIAPDRTLHPRTGYGLSADNLFLVLLVIDGRQDASQGATVHEVGTLLLYFGAHTGINMDGGGSTTMAWWNPGKEEVEVLNSPSRGERKVGSNLGIFRVPTAD